MIAEEEKLRTYLRTVRDILILMQTLCLGINATQMLEGSIIDKVDNN
jgi:hypothetical protein